MSRLLVVLILSVFGLGAAEAHDLFACKDLSQARRTIKKTMDNKTGEIFYFLNSSNFKSKNKRVFFGEESDDKLSITETDVEYRIERVDIYKFITDTKSLILNKKTGMAVYEHSKETEVYRDIIRRDNLYNCKDLRSL